MYNHLHIIYYYGFEILCNLEVKEIIVSTNNNQIGVLPNDALYLVVDIGILRIRFKDQYLTMTLMSGFARIGNNEIVF